MIQRYNWLNRIEPYDKVDYNSRKGYGFIWQGSAMKNPDDYNRINGKVFVVNLQKFGSDDDLDFLTDLNSVDMKKVVGFINLGIYDIDGFTIDEDALVAALVMCRSLLQSGVNLYIHCAAGISRSSYFNVALHMLLYRMPARLALQHVKKYHAQAFPNEGFMNHLEDNNFIKRLASV